MVAEKFVKKIEFLHKILTQKISEAQNRQAKYYFTYYKPVELSQKNKVILNAKNLKTRRFYKKLNHVYIGPFKILRAVNSQFYKLKLSKSIKVHPVFYVFFFIFYNANILKGRIKKLFPPIQGITEKKEKYEVNKVLNLKMVRGRLKYLIR